MTNRLICAAAAALLLTAGLTAQAQQGGRGQRPQFTVPPLPAEPVVYETAEGMDIRLVVIARGLEYPWSIGFLPNGDTLVVERAGRLRLIRNDVLLPAPVRGVPDVQVTGSAGLGDIAVHPDFISNRLIYLSYNKPLGERATALAIARGIWDGNALTDVQDIFVTEEAGGISRLMFGPEGKLFVSTFVGGDPETAQDPNVLAGKVLRLNDDGSVPADNPFVGMADHKAEIFTLGHRTPSGLTVHWPSNTVYELEMGPNGGDEVNALVAGGNYGWPVVSLGRDYAGPWQSQTFSREDVQNPVVFWMPSISTSGLDFYTGQRLGAWNGDLFIGGMRYGEITGTGQLHRVRFNEDMQELRREILFADLRHRIRDVRMGPDELLYLLTDSDDGAVLRIEPAEAELGQGRAAPAAVPSALVGRIDDIRSAEDADTAAMAGVVDAILNSDISAARVDQEAQFRAESRDADWAPRIENRLNNWIADSGLGFANITAECKSSSCLVTLQHASVLSEAEGQAVMAGISALTRELVEDPGSEIQGMSASTMQGQAQSMTRLRLTRYGAH